MQNEYESLADRMALADPVAAKDAKLSLERAAHKAAAPGTGKRRKTAADEILDALKKPRPRVVRAHLLRLLGFVGGREHERALGAFERDPETGEDARMARERIRRGP